MKKRARKIELHNILYRIYYKGEASKPELAEEFGVSLPAISTHVNKLEESGWLVETEKGISSGGRKPLLYSLNPDHGYVVGVNLRSSHFYIFIANLSGQVIKNKLVEIEDRRFEAYVEWLCDATNELLSALDVELTAVLGMGICISGVTDFEHKVVDRSKELDWTYMPLCKVLEQRLGIPTFVENDSRVYARNEIDPSDPDHVGAVFYLADSVGLALVIENRVFQGYTNRAGDNRFFGESRDRLLQIIQDNHLIRDLTQQPYYPSLEPRKVRNLNEKVDKHLQEHPENIKVIDDFTTHLAQLMVTMVNVLNPKRVLLTGNVFDYSDIIYEETRKKILRAKRVYTIPEIRRTAALENPLETALVKFILEKFFTEEHFRL